MKDTREQEQSGQEKLYWVILSALEHFISGHDTLAEAEVEAERLNQQTFVQNRSPHYVATIRRQPAD